MSHGTALITGASRGIGRALAAAFAAEGHDVILVARSRDELRDSASDLRARFGISAEALARDLGRPGAAQALFALLEKRGTSVDILVNNAGILEDGDFADTPLERHLALLQVNVVAPTTLTRLFLGPMIDRGYGRVLNVASIAAFQPLARLALYAAAKAYTLHLTEALAEELVGTGVTATALCPGFTETGMMSLAPDWVPSFAVGTAEEVARDGYKACMSGTPVYVSGAANRLITEVVRFQPRWLVRAMSGMMARRGR